MDFVYTDGMCLDDDGQIWLANAIAPQCLRVKEGGEITGVVTTTQTLFCLHARAARIAARSTS